MWITNLLYQLFSRIYFLLLHSYISAATQTCSVVPTAEIEQIHQQPDIHSQGSVDANDTKSRQSHKEAAYSSSLPHLTQQLNGFEFNPNKSMVTNNDSHSSYANLSPDQGGPSGEYQTVDNIADYDNFQNIDNLDNLTQHVAYQDHFEKSIPPNLVETTTLTDHVAQQDSVIRNSSTSNSTENIVPQSTEQTSNTDTVNENLAPMNYIPQSRPLMSCANRGRATISDSFRPICSVRHTLKDITNLYQNQNGNNENRGDDNSENGRCRSYRARINDLNQALNQNFLERRYQRDRARENVDRRLISAKADTSNKIPYESRSMLNNNYKSTYSSSSSIYGRKYNEVQGPSDQWRDSTQLGLKEKQSLNASRDQGLQGLGVGLSQVGVESRVALLESTIEQVDLEYVGSSKPTNSRQVTTLGLDLKGIKREEQKYLIDNEALDSSRSSSTTQCNLSEIDIEDREDTQQDYEENNEVLNLSRRLVFDDDEEEDDDDEDDLSKETQATDETKRNRFGLGTSKSQYNVQLPTYTHQNNIGFVGTRLNKSSFDYSTKSSGLVVPDYSPKSNIPIPLHSRQQQSSKTLNNNNKFSQALQKDGAHQNIQQKLNKGHKKVDRGLARLGDIKGRIPKRKTQQKPKNNVKQQYPPKRELTCIKQTRPSEDCITKKSEIFEGRNWNNEGRVCKNKQTENKKVLWKQQDPIDGRDLVEMTQRVKAVIDHKMEDDSDELLKARQLVQTIERVQSSRLQTSEEQSEAIELLVKQQIDLTTKLKYYERN
eukprot:TRINITY_DN601_c0_g1_i3.p1 TRINITY_DN601_c0_g1~~TRINITY_DN601_c0_g1_i3.p1  ORF type:complete len:771 (+),score=87.51 TRINITY_DN601_c0_g1_i3:84-2396(+)